MSQTLGSFDTGLAVLPPVNSLYKKAVLPDGITISSHLDLSSLYVAIEQQNTKPSDMKKKIYELAGELEHAQTVI